MQTLTDSEIVRLSVGGQVFVTTRTTLTSQPGVLAAMFWGEFQPTCLREQDGSYSIDRDHTHFGAVLNYLRDGSVALPPGAEARTALRQEAQFYNLAGLHKAVDGASAAEVARVQKLLAELEKALQMVDIRLRLPESLLNEATFFAVEEKDRSWVAQLMAALAELDGQRHRLLQAKAAALAELQALGA